MYPAQNLESSRIERLRAQRHAVDTDGTVFSEAAALYRAGVGLHCDFNIGGDGQMFASCRDHAADRFRRKQAGRASAQKEADDLPTRHFERLPLDVLLEGIDVPTLGELPVKGVGVEVAVWALTHAPWEMD